MSRDVMLAPDIEEPRVDLSAPLVVKVISPDIPHKTEVGAVRLNIDLPSLHTAIREVRAAAIAAVPHARIEGVMVSEMITDGVETLVGVVRSGVRTSGSPWVWAAYSQIC